MQNAANKNPENSKTMSVLFICTANVCRSPMAHGIFQDMVLRLGLQQHILVDSAGTNASSTAKAPEPRALRVASLEGYRLNHLRSRQLVVEDFERFDYIVCMDNTHLEKANALADGNYQGTLKVLMEYAQGLDISDIPDPYYGGITDFKRSLTLVEIGCFGLIEAIVKKHFKR